MLYLASASPRRKELLEQMGVDFAVYVPNVDESIAALPPEEAVLTVARRKAWAARGALPNQSILAADTVVVLADQILGKPKDKTDAKRMLTLLSGCWHQVMTAMCLLGEDGQEKAAVSIAKCRFAALTSEEIEAYIATGEPFDKAGAYALQGRAGAFVESIEGDPYTIIGLPICKLRQWLRGL